MSDSEAVRGVLAGNLDLFAVLYEHNKGTVFDCLFRMGLDQSEAEEQAELVWLDVSEKLSQYDRRRPFSLWVRGFARNQGKAALRRRGRESCQVSLEEIPEDEEPSCPGPEEEHERALAMQEMEQMLAPLHGLRKEAVTLRCACGLPLKEVAEIQHRKVGTVKSDVHRGLATVRRVMKQRE